MNETLFDRINTFARATPWLHGVIAAYAAYGVVVFALLLAGGLWVARTDGRAAVLAAAVWAPLGMLLALAINQPISEAVGERRPCAALPGIIVLAHCGKDFSFPSDHATMAGAVAAGLLVVTRRAVAWLAVAAAVLMAASRVYVAAHYPHDVAAGLLVGALITLAGWLAARRLLTRLVEALRATPLRPLLVSAAPPGRHAAGHAASSAQRPLP